MNEQAKKMRAAGMKISALMGFTMSLCLSLFENITSGHFSLPLFFITFLASLIVSLIIGFIVPMKKVTDAAREMFRLKEGTVPARVVESITSDLIYTPVITLLMVTIVYNITRRQIAASVPPEQLEAVLAGLPGFGQMFLVSLAECMVVGFVLIYFFTPIFTRMVLGGMQGQRG